MTVVLRRSISYLSLLFLMFSGVLCAGASPTYAAQPDALTSSFTAPPDSAKPHTWWHWMNGNVTREGITADLEAMKRAGLGGAQIFAASEGIPAGPVKYMSPEWQNMVKYAAQEANRLGLELCIHNCAGWSSSGGPWITPQYAMQMVVTSERQVPGGTHFEEVLPHPSVHNDFYRDIAVLAFKTPDPQRHLKIENLQGKAGYERADNIEPAGSATAPADLVVEHNQVMDLTSHMSADGRLTWDAPAGDWTVLRLGYTPTGVTNHPAPPEGTGPECDKLSREAMDVHFNGMLQKIINDLGPLAGKSLNNVLIDSYEVGSQNWTPKFREEFRQRRGYDLLPYLPILSNRVVDSPLVSERFLRDFRRTIADLFTENYYGRMAELCHQHGMLFSDEPYGDGNFEDLTCGGRADIPMGEFWVGGGASGSCKLASSVAHTYGRRFVGAESFTATPDKGRWTNDPYALKGVGDLMYCSGINRFIFHRYAHQPWLNRFPGMTMGQWGTHFERTNTWWNQGSALLQYQARCQSLLQQGLFVGDAVYFCGENAPVSLRAGNPALPAGYDYDGCNAEVILNRMSVRNGRIVLPDGMSYRVLVLPPDKSMTPQLISKIRQLVAQGATIVGPKPTYSPSLQNYPLCDQQVKIMADEMWGKSDGKTITQHSYGRGQVVWGQPLDQVFAAMQLKPDFEYPTNAARLAYIHRSTRDADVYFVSNQRARTTDVDCTFRMAGKVPELWQPESGKTELAPVYSEKNGRITVPLHFDPSGSVFVVFRQPSNRGNHFINVAHVGPAVVNAPMPKLEIQHAVYEAVDGTGAADVTAKLASQIKDNTLSIEATNELFGDPTPLHVKQLRVDYTVNGKPFSVTLPEHGMLEIPSSGGVVAYPPYELGVTPNGRVQLTAWQPGSYTFTSTKGRTSTTTVTTSNPLTLTGPWELRFPPNWGAPPQVSLDKLISWPEHSDNGVKYFSGTATYVKDIVLPTSMLQPDQTLSLDLGQVKNIAQVSLNGRDLGILWKPPFRVDISRFAHPGSNHLEIRVTNLWPNRLIGDEQLPEDREWNGISLKAWPQWLLEGKPSPTGRYTFTTWHHWKKDDHLLESGLLGPVTLRAATVVTVR